MDSKSDIKNYKINEQIKADEVRLIGEEGNQLGIVTLEHALSVAADADMDLVEISPSANPPVCKVMNYGKYLFNLNKKHSECKKKQKLARLKEVKLRPVIESGDYNIKIKRIIEFLDDSGKVRITIKFRGRELTYYKFGVDIMNRICLDVAEHGVVEQPMKLEGKQMVMVLAQKKNK